MMTRTFLIGAILLVAFIAVNSEQVNGETIIGSDGIPMALVSAGEFEMGDAVNKGKLTERPSHMVYLNTFYLDVHEVTNAQYARFLNEYGSNTDYAGHKLLNTFGNSCMIKRIGNTYKAIDEYENHPVVEVTWYGAVAYAQFYGKRLPTEAEWEKGARDGIAGNISHWCADWYDPDYYEKSPKQNPLGPDSGYFRVVRGGGYYTKDHLRVTCRSGRPAADTFAYVGFRCASSKIDGEITSYLIPNK